MSGEIKRRARHVASDEAHAWARSLPLHNPFAKSVLRAMALYVNGEGCCFVSLEQLAADTDMSIDTVRRRAAWLDSIGAIVRLPQWIDENGKRNSGDRGKRTTDEIRLLLNADPDAIEARATGADNQSQPADAADVSPSPQQGLTENASPSMQQGLNSEGIAVSPSTQQGLNRDQASDSPRLALGQPSHSCEGLISEPEPEPEEDSPLPPKDGGSDDGWLEFEKDWRDPILRQSIARQRWSALSKAEKEVARNAARGYVAWRKSQKNPPNVINAHKFLKERDAWPRFVVWAPATSDNASSQFEARDAIAEVGPLHDSWRTIKRKLEATLGADKVRAWLDPLKVEKVDEDEITLSAPTKFFAQFNSTNHEDLLLSAWRAVEPSLKRLRFEVRGRRWPRASAGLPAATGDRSAAGEGLDGRKGQAASSTSGDGATEQTRRAVAAASGGN